MTPAEASPDWPLISDNLLFLFSSRGLRIADDEDQEPLFSQPIIEFLEKSSVLEIN